MGSRFKRNESLRFLVFRKPATAFKILLSEVERKKTHKCEA